jgi:phosphatidylserine/phosphatidylglycerophosphate/cardiolipin synthase-like enzyme
VVKLRHRRRNRRAGLGRLLFLLLLTLALTGCDAGGMPQLATFTPIPNISRAPLPTLAPDVPTPGVQPSPPPPTVPPPTPDVVPDPRPTNTRPPDGPVPLPTLAPAPAPTLPGQAIDLPRDIGYDGGWWAVLFSPGKNGNEANGRFILDKLIGYIDAAQSSIHLAVFETDMTSVAEALARAHARGVDVRWITDDEHGIDADGEPGRGQFALLEDAGVPIRDDLRSALMHNKFVIIDDHIVWTGSMNLTMNDVFRNNNNIVVIESPEVAAVFRAEFDEMWDGRFGPRSPSQAGQDVFDRNQRPFIIRFAPEDDPMADLVQLAGLAERSIHFMTFSFTHDELGAVMRERAAAGVVVRGIFETFGSETIYSEMTPLFCAGIDVRQDGNAGMFHHKVIIIDEMVVVTGSLNFSDNAAGSNDENYLMLADAGVAGLYMEEFDRRWAETRPLSAADIDCR